ncbi:MAG TPA: hypothetical protein PKC87_04035 [Candidatus Absconditabacterales bacterium]|nr:hypothetical protein [Candidatus Absconditabacterales bacterium]
MKKIITLLTLSCLFSISMATEISFSPEKGEVANNCLVALDIMIDTDNKEIAASDIVIESSLDFVDFVPSKLFPYFLPPKVSNNLIHLVGFTVDPKNRVQGSGSIGTLYMQQKNTSDADGTLKLYFKKKGDTTDSNLSIAGGIDILDSVGSAYFTFTEDGACAHAVGESLNGGIADKSVKMLLAKLDRQQLFQKIFNRKVISLFAGLLIIITLLFIYYKGTKKGKNV